jgi:uncharacterized membrane protein YoaK (UPF0700 family)
MTAAAEPARAAAAVDRDLLLAGLTFSSGAVDAIAFLGLGKIFTAFQTGNVVFLGIGAAGAGGPGLIRVAASLLAFAAGVFAATRIVLATSGAGPWPSRVTVALGVALTAQAAFLALWLAASGRPDAGTGDTLAAVSALAMGLQSGAVLSLGVAGVFTTAATATLMFLSRGEAPHARFAGTLIALCSGAAAGGLLLVHARAYAPVLPLAATALVVAAAAASPVTEGR